MTTTPPPMPSTGPTSTDGPLGPVQAVWAADTLLGEGLLWHAPSQRLFLVDIRRQQLLAWHPASGQGQRWTLPQPAGWLLPCADGGWIVGLRDGVARIDLDVADTPPAEWLLRLHPADSGLRLNDAKVDAAGCVWFGTMHNVHEDQPHGRLLRLHPDERLEVVEAGENSLCVPNGPAVSPDGLSLLHSDSARRQTWRYTLDAQGRVASRSLWRLTQGPEDQEGYPDGMCFDAAGQLWQARWGAACITRLDPQGQETARWATGAPHTSNCCFGGPALQDLYITTSHARLSPAERAAHPHAGQLLVLRQAGQGLPARAWGGAGRLQGGEPVVPEPTPALMPTPATAP